MSYTKNESDLTALRPSLELSVAQSSEEERFQNLVIRPIVKMQHELLINLVQHFPHFNNVMKSRDNYQKFRENLTVYLNKNQSTKHQLIGTVIGMMTMSELTEYMYNTQVFNKRIVNIIAKRVADTLQEEIQTY